ncbi:hypothetical protein FQR65_LT15343 [Abscondita terminalis]|nr:hypothetical protein FQR65_LT15343 [Abscondita terminalis]
MLSYAEEISEIEGVDLVLGAKEKFNILSYLMILENPKSCTRGISRSDTVENVIKNASEIAAQDIKEIVLTGVNIGDYGKGEFGNKRHEHTFLDLVKELNMTKLLIWYRPAKAFVPHFHIPLQSGSDEVLKKMKRRYLTQLYRNRVSKIREVMPDACIGVDVIVGFPGETEEEFMKTYQFLNELPISYLHVFTYSERENTEAATMQGIVPIAERKKRNKMLRILSEKKKMAFYQTQLGKTLPVLWEHENKDGLMYGFTENYVRVHKPLNALTLINRTGKVRQQLKLMEQVSILAGLMLFWLKL